MQAIAEWLKNGTYEQGVLLYQQHGGNSFLKQKFKGGANEYNAAKLREELSRLADGAAPVHEPKPVATKPQAERPAPPATDLAKKYLSLVNKKTKLYLQQNMLMEQKHHLPEGDELRLCAVAILSTNQQLMEVWAQIDYYQAHGKFPDEEVVEKPALEPKKEMQLLRQTISKAKTRLESPTCRGGRGS